MLYLAQTDNITFPLNYTAEANNVILEGDSEYTYIKAVTIIIVYLTYSVNCVMPLVNICLIIYLPADITYIYRLIIIVIIE